MSWPLTLGKPIEGLRRYYLSVDLRARLMMLTIVPVIIFAVIWGSHVIYQRGADLHGQLRERGAMLGRQMSIAADYGMFSQNRAALDSLAAGVANETGVASAMLLDPDASIKVRHDGKAGLDEVAWLNLRQELVLAIQNQLPPTVMKHGELIAVLNPVRTPELSIEDYPDLTEPSRQSIQGYSLVLLSSKEVKFELLRFGLTVVLLLVGILFGVGKVASNFSNRINRQLLALEETALQIGAGAFGVRLAPSGVPAFDRLCSHINVMAHQLEQSRRQLEHRVQQATQAVREQRDAAERANQEKSRFLATASHDLRQPMHALNMIIAALRQEQAVEGRIDLLNRAETTAQAMSDLLNALLDISRLDAGGVTPRPGNFALEPLFQRLRDTYDSLAKRRDIALTIRPASNLWVKSDPEMLERIIGNFISNAIRYTPPGGQVMVAARRRGGNLLIEVRDNGMGIDPESQRLIFQEFVQLHNPQRNRSEGLGLGLAIVQRLARLLFHPINLRSCAGHGSTFSVMAPRAIAEAASPLAEPDAPRADQLTLNGCQILLVEDDALVRASYQRLLELWGCEVFAYADGNSAVAECRARRDWRPDLILTDFRLNPVLDGYTLVQVLRDLYKVRIPALIVSGDTENRRLTTLSELETKVLFKPVRPNILGQTLRELKT